MLQHCYTPLYPDTHCYIPVAPLLHSVIPSYTPLHPIKSPSQHHVTPIYTSATPCYIPVSPCNNPVTPCYIPVIQCYTPLHPSRGATTKILSPCSLQFFFSSTKLRISRSTIWVEMSSALSYVSNFNLTELSRTIRSCLYYTRHISSPMVFNDLLYFLKRNRRKHYYFASTDLPVCAILIDYSCVIARHD